jgi:hypothetical protein
MLLGAALAGHAFAAGRAVVLIFLAITIAVGGWLTGQWMTGDLDPGSVHAGYLLPTVAGGLVGAYAAAQAGLPAIAEASFGIGIVCWFLLRRLWLVLSCRRDLRTLWLGRPRLCATGSGASKKPKRTRRPKGECTPTSDISTFMRPEDLA